MAYRIGDECARCGECEWVCVNEAISLVGTMFVIDPAKCTECVGDFDSPQCAAICPVECCVPE